MRLHPSDLPYDRNASNCSTSAGAVINREERNRVRRMINRNAKLIEFPPRPSFRKPDINARIKRVPARELSRYMRLPFAARRWIHATLFNSRGWESLSDRWNGTGRRRITYYPGSSLAVEMPGASCSARPETARSFCDSRRYSRRRAATRRRKRLSRYVSSN